MVGRFLTARARQQGRDVLALTSAQWDITDPAAAERFIQAGDVVVNCAAFTKVDAAEDEPERAHAVNVVGPENVAHACARAGAALIHISTDYVFSGSQRRPYEIDDETGPLSVYGRTKLAGEHAISAANPRHLILRTSWVYAARGGNFAKTMLKLARERDRLTVIDDQFGAPTGADLLADVTAHALRSLRAGGGAAGTYHVAAAGETTWNGYARFVVGKAQQAGEKLKAGPEQVEPVPTSAFPTPARRPHNSRLDTSRFRAAFELALPPWQQGVARMLQEIL